MTRPFSQLASTLVARIKRARTAGEGPYGAGAAKGFAKVSKAAAADSNISDATYRVLGLLAAYADKDGWCYPAVGTLAKQRGVTRQAIQHHIRILIANRYVDVSPQKRSNGGHRPNLYRIHLEYDSQATAGALGRVPGKVGHSPSPIHQSSISAAPDAIGDGASALPCMGNDER